MSTYRELQAIHDDRDKMREAIANAGLGVDTTVFRNEEMRYTKELEESIPYWAEQDRLRAETAAAEQIGGLKETILNIRDAVYLKELMDRVLGLTENTTAIQEFNSMVDQAVDENQSLLIAGFQRQLAEKDEKIRLLSVQGLETQRQLDTAKEEVADYLKVNAELAEQVEFQQYSIQTLEQNVEDRNGAIEQNVQEIQRLNQHIFDLQKQIANFQTVPQVIDITPSIPSESLQDRIAKAKVNSKLQLANVKSIGANWVEGINSEGNKEVAHVSDVEPVYEFPNIEKLKEQEAPAEEKTFPESNQVAADSNGEDQTVQGNGDMAEVVAEGSIEPKPLDQQLAQLYERHSALEARVAALEAVV